VKPVNALKDVGANDVTTVLAVDKNFMLLGHAGYMMSLSLVPCMVICVRPVSPVRSSVDKLGE